MKTLNPIEGNETEPSSVERTISLYEQALNSADVDAIMAVFTPDGVFMAPNSVSTVGSEAIRAAYDGLFQAISFETRLQVDEIVNVAPDWAFARTNSAGFVTVRANGQRLPDANHELFIFQKAKDGAWKIARYSFATTNPPAN